MLIVICFLLAFYGGIIYGVFQDAQKAAERRTERHRRRVDQELKQLDFEERLQTFNDESVYIMNQLAREQDTNKAIKLHKELQRVQKQRFITKYKES